MSDAETGLLERIHAEQKEAGETVAGSAAADDIRRLQEYARQHLDCALPEAYLAFLAQSDGLDFNGHVIYATRERRGEGAVVLGFADANETFRGGGERHHVLFGETGDELFAFDAAQGNWRFLDRGSLSPLETFENFDTALRRFLERAYET